MCRSTFLVSNDLKCWLRYFNHILNKQHQCSSRLMNICFDLVSDMHADLWPGEQLVLPHEMVPQSKTVSL